MVGRLISNQYHCDDIVFEGPGSADFSPLVSKYFKI